MQSVINDTNDRIYFKHNLTLNELKTTDKVNDITEIIAVSKLFYNPQGILIRVFLSFILNEQIGNTLLDEFITDVDELPFDNSYPKPGSNKIILHNTIYKKTDKIWHLFIMYNESKEYFTTNFDLTCRLAGLLKDNIIINRYELEGYSPDPHVDLDNKLE